MFEQLPAWHSKISLRGAIVNAIGFGFVAGMACGTFVLSALRLPVHPLQLLWMAVFPSSLRRRWQYRCIFLSYLAYERAIAE